MNRTARVVGLLAALAAGGCGKQSAPSADVWATVNAKEIRKEEVEKYYRSSAQPEGPAPSLEEANTTKLNILDELINQEIMLERAQKLGLEATDGEVEDKFTENKSPFTEDEFQRQLKDRGMSVDDLKRGLRRQISIQKLINREVVAKISITDQDISEYYNKNRAQFNVTETQFRVAQIVVTPRLEPQLRNRKGNDAASDAEAQRKIRALYEQIRNGADFSAAAMDFSEDPATVSSGGDLGYVPESSFAQASPDLRKVVLGMKVGEVSNVLSAGGSYRILKLLAREAPGQRALNDPAVQQAVREGLRNRKEQLLRAAFMSVARGEAKVENYLARQILESTGKLPELAPAVAPAVGKQ